MTFIYIIHKYNATAMTRFGNIVVFVFLLSSACKQEDIGPEIRTSQPEYKIQYEYMPSPHTSGHLQNIDEVAEEQMNLMPVTRKRRKAS